MVAGSIPARGANDFKGLSGFSEPSKGSNPSPVPHSSRPHGRWRPYFGALSQLMARRGSEERGRAGAAWQAADAGLTRPCRGDLSLPAVASLPTIVRPRRWCTVGERSLREQYADYGRRLLFRSWLRSRAYPSRRSLCGNCRCAWGCGVRSGAPRSYPCVVSIAGPRLCPRMLCSP
jgi:hypothetical protein